MQSLGTDILDQASTFIQQFYVENNLVGIEFRLEQIRSQISHTGSYELTYEELAYGAKLAWRNSNRCIGRLYWKSLKIRDRRHLTLPESIFEDLLDHLDFATNEGKIRSTITIYPAHTDGLEGPRILNKQLIRYAGHSMANGEILGDPDSMDFTRFCESLGWKPDYTAFDILPLVIQVGNDEPQWFEIPEEKVLRVQISHPEYSWISEMNIQWYAVPLISDMRLEIGGISFPCAPFNGWYMLTEIAVRNLADVHRYNLLPQLAKQMKLDTKQPRSLWKEKALLVLQEAVLYSYHEKGVNLVDHHTASEQFLEFCRIEESKGRKVQADWAWIVPPSAGSTMGVFHQDWENLELRPNFFYQKNPTPSNPGIYKTKPSSCPYSMG
jgi:nitric-oxide synthase